jgi:hypothetical protein
MRVELISIEEIADYLDQRAYYQGAYLMSMIKRQGDGPEEPASTYLAMAMADPAEGRFGVRPQVTGAGAVMLPAPEWSADPCGIEPPLGYSIEDLPAVGGASEPLPGREDASSISQRAKDDTDGRE